MSLLLPLHWNVFFTTAVLAATHFPHDPVVSRLANTLGALCDFVACEGRRGHMLCSST